MFEIQVKHQSLFLAKSSSSVCGYGCMEVDKKMQTYLSFSNPAFHISHCSSHFCLSAPPPNVQKHIKYLLNFKYMSIFIGIY